MKYMITKFRRNSSFGRPTHGIFRDGELVALTYDQETALTIVDCFVGLATIENRLDILEEGLSILKSSKSKLSKIRKRK